MRFIGRKGCSECLRPEKTLPCSTHINIPILNELTLPSSLLVRRQSPIRESLKRFGMRQQVPLKTNTWRTLLESVTSQFQKHGWRKRGYTEWGCSRTSQGSNHRAESRHQFLPVSSPLSQEAAVMNSGKAMQLCQTVLRIIIYFSSLCFV